MKYVVEFRDAATARGLVEAIKKEIEQNREYRLMEFCGGHTHAIFRHGLRDLLPHNVRYIHGPGCPVCVLPAARLESLMQLVERQSITLCSYGDMLRVPSGAGRTLQRIKAQGSDVRMVYSTQDALQIARNEPQREVVFFAVGFETTAPATAAALLQAQREGLKNFSIYCNHVLTPPAMAAILQCGGRENIHAILGPSHVSTIIGADAYTAISQRYQMPIVIAGFEPLDVLQATLMAIRQINRNEYYVENEYRRAVSQAGNEKAQAMMGEVFSLRDTFAWRGLGELAHSALGLSEAYAGFDTERRFEMVSSTVVENAACACAEVLRGETEPQQCKLFGKVCQPDNPIGACMVSAEGACAAWWHYGAQPQEEGTG